ncbi:hypothetical protein [Streptomyces yokosukanensis]|uniref:hypothetical protein n=1 Tax=Streptomyces yokosukanensis TaxID=67386 RepID=UPI00131DFEA3|nr:hypothetical protein [Streptomyces yokosukanensis]
MTECRSQVSGLHDRAVTLLQEEPGDVLGDRKAPFLHKDQRALGPLFGGRVVWVHDHQMSAAVGLVISV